MSAWSGFGSRIIAAIQNRAERKRMAAGGPIGDFYRGGGNSQLYLDLPLCQDDLVLDAGGYKGEWTAGILTRYGCRSEIFEPVPAFAEHCRALYRHNSRVRVHQAALGGRSRTAHFNLDNNGTSEFGGSSASERVLGQVHAVSDVLARLGDTGEIRPGAGAIGVLKLNIEGGEYEVLESLLESGAMNRMRCLLVQFHRQPEGWEMRYKRTVHGLRETHEPVWCYPMVWEKWLLRQP